MVRSVTPRPHHPTTKGLSMKLFRIPTVFGVFTLLFLCSSGVQAEDAFPRFEPNTIDPEVGKVCYAVTLADVDGDGNTDIVALSESRVVWYDAVTWTPHVILKDQTPPDNVCIAPHDIDGDGQVDFAIGAGWTKTGTLHWIHRKDAPSAPWQVEAIGEETSVHRIRWADVLGKGSPQLVVSPLNASVGDGVRLLAFEVPKVPSKDRWPSTVLNADLNRMHNHWHVDFDGDSLIDTITASREGLSLVRRTEGDWKLHRLGSGVTGNEDPNLNGAGEVKIGKLRDGRRFLTSVEPMHGDRLAVYLEPSRKGEKWERLQIDEGFKRGHALWTSDFDGDGSDDIAFGHSDTPMTFGVSVYHCTSDDGKSWKKEVVDEGGMATEDLVVGDLNGDKRPDIVAGGRATHNVKLYLNVKSP
jgi:hypothetical protein